MPPAQSYYIPCIMGCSSSSAPNTISANSSKEDKSIQFEEDAEETYSKHVEAINTESENRTEIKVLPRSDTIETIQQLVRNIKSTTSLEPEKDLNTSGQVLESGHIDNSNITKNSKDEDKDDAISKFKLEEVVGKFIEITQDTNHDKDAVNHNNEEAAEFAENDNDETDTKIESKENDDEHENNSHEAEEASPSQSQSSRATRWEALADIAAELPPSLAVDPLTGQIYSLSK